MQTTEKLRPFGARDKIGYAMGDLGCNLSFQLISSYMFLFYTQCIGLTTTNWAWIIVVSKIWDAVNDIIIGGMVDRHRLSKKSKFMPWIAIGSVGLLAFSILLFLPVQQLSQAGKAIWLPFDLRALYDRLHHGQCSIRFPALRHHRRPEAAHLAFHLPQHRCGCCCCSRHAASAGRVCE